MLHSQTTKTYNRKSIVTKFNKDLEKYFKEGNRPRTEDLSRWVCKTAELAAQSLNSDVSEAEHLGYPAGPEEQLAQGASARGGLGAESRSSPAWPCRAAPDLG